MKNLVFVLLFTSCQFINKKNKEFNFENHIKSNEWCAFIKENQSCFTFNDSEMIFEINGVAQATIKVNFNQKSDSIVIVKVVGEQGIENLFRMKSLNTLYYSQVGDEDNITEFTRIE